MKQEEFPAGEENINIRPMYVEDIRRVMTIEKQVFDHPWPREAFLTYLLSSLPHEYIVAENQELLLGYAGAHEKNEKFHLVNMAVKAGWQRRGIGSLLLNRIFKLGREKSLSQIFLEVRESNRAAISFYEQHNFRQQALRRNYYTDNNENAIVMVRSLK